MKFKSKDMSDFAEKIHPPTLAGTDKVHKYYPSITVDAKDVSVGDSAVGSMATLHAHVKVKRIEDGEDGKRVTLEIQKGDAKPGLNPLTKSGKKVMKNMQGGYGGKKGKSVSYASINKGKPGTSKWECKSIRTRIKAGK